MTNSDEVKGVLLDVISEGLLRIRALGYAGRHEACAVEADHIHNLPAIVKVFRPEEVRYYYNVSRTSFIRHATPDVDRFKPLWDRLGKLLDLPA